MNNAEERSWNISSRRRELQWHQFKRQLSNRRTIHLVIGLPAIVVFVLLSCALYGQVLPRNIWTITVMCALLCIFTILQLWPQPKLPLESKFHEEAARQVDAELSA